MSGITLHTLLNLLSAEKWRVFLKGQSPDYIHASFANVNLIIHALIDTQSCYPISLQGYKQKKAFIIAQSPMESTVTDFVKMLYERECGVVVMLCGCEEGGVEMCTQYWPASGGKTMKYGEFLVSNLSINISGGVTKRTITITDPKVLKRNEPNFCKL